MQAQAHSGATERKGAERMLSAETTRGIGQLREDKSKRWGRYGVADGTRTHDNRNHNPGLYQLSYSHH